MDRPFDNDNISQIHEADTLYDSHLTSFNEVQQADKFKDQRNYTKSILNNWGISMGSLIYNQDNQLTLRCIVQLIQFRQKQLIFREKMKDDVSALTFQKEKYRSYMQQGKTLIEEYNKRIGKLQNENADLKAKLKRLQSNNKKQKDQDKKMLTMLRNKNQQTLHQIKKKQQEVNKIKQQMKKSVGQKTLTAAKNNFQIYENIQSQSIVRKNASDKMAEQKYVFLMERNERELNLAMKENKILREKIFDVRDELLKFNMWVDSQIFGQKLQQNVQTKRKYSNKFYINHNLLFKKECLKDEFVQLLEITKDGLLQLRSFYKEPRTSPKINRKTDFHLPSSSQDITQTTFKKKTTIKPEKIYDSKTKNYDLHSSKQQERRSNKIKSFKEETFKQQNMTPPSTKQLQYNEISQNKVNIKNKNRNSGYDNKKVGKIQTYNHISSQKLIKNEKSNKNLNEIVQNRQQIYLQDDLLDDQNDISITSHISVQKLGKGRFDKWEILFRDQNV